MSSHWGEIASIVETESGIAAIEREQITKPRPIEVEGPRLHQPSSKHYPPTHDPHPAEYFAPDCLVLHTIKLVQHARKVRQLIHNVQQNIYPEAKTVEGEGSGYPESPPIPECERRQTKHQLHKPVPFLPKDHESDFARGIGKAPPEIDNASCRRLLRKSVAAICAHAGFDCCPDSVLELLTEVCQEYFIQMTRNLRHAVDNEARLGSTGFQDVIQQVFREMGIGETRELHTFYQTRILNYHDNMLTTCQQLVEDYEKAKSPDVKPEDAKKNVKDELLSDIQFPSTEDSEEILDAEQLLQLEDLGLHISIVQDTGSSPAQEEDSKWQQAQQQQSSKSESQEPKLAHMESYDGDGADSLTGTPATPHLGSEAGDSIQDPGSVPVTDIMSPPPSGVRPSKPPKKKKKK